MNQLLVRHLTYEPTDASSGWSRMKAMSADSAGPGLRPGTGR